MNDSTFKLSKTQIKKLEKEVEDRVWNAGMYRKRAGCWNITAKFSEQLSEMLLDDEYPSLYIGFEITATENTDNSSSSEWWNVKVKLCKMGLCKMGEIQDIERY